ncbi:MAG TPA: flavoprotein, partial [Nitrospira sp.]|nr:flavoprotein [Nitrospira sp.]
MDEPQLPSILSGKRLVLGVTGSIASYKAVELLRALAGEGATVSVVMTHAATKFVTPLTFEVLSGNRVATDLFKSHDEMSHLALPGQ